MLTAGCGLDAGPVVRPEPEEWLKVGSFEMGRWKVHYARGDSFQFRGDYYWHTILRFKGSKVDFCTPKGWGGSALCSDREWVGEFSLSTPHVVSDNPPALLVPYGGTSGNGDAETWLFVERNGQLEKTRLSVRNDGLWDLANNRLDRGGAWDLRNYPVIAINNSNWFDTASLRQIELAEPQGIAYLSFASRSPDGRWVARAGYTDSLSTGLQALLLVVTDLDSPSDSATYAVEGMNDDQMTARDELVARFQQYFTWSPEQAGQLVATNRRKARLRPLDAVLTRTSTRTTAPQHESPDTVHFIPKATASQIPLVCSAILNVTGAEGRMRYTLHDEATLEIADWGDLVLKASDIGIEIRTGKENWRIAHDVAAQLQRSILRGQAPFGAGSSPMKEQCANPGHPA
ncbi:Uncharacterized protein ToN1_36180 [Aromatoleum petrolei]|nr:Uncharacterized protein ToN1_36180 [Aromatoleum petrolei]